MNPRKEWMLVLENTGESVTLVEPFLRRIGVVDCLNKRRYHDFVVALTEAVNNAISHGNAADPSAQVMVCVTVADTQVMATVTDSGKGFNADAVPDPRLPENLRSEGGRGVFLMRQLADEVVFTQLEVGMRVEIRYRR